MVSFKADFIGKIRVMQIIARLNIGGATMHVVNLSTKLKPARFDSLLVSGTENPGKVPWWTTPCFGVQPLVIPEMVVRPHLSSGMGKRWLNSTASFAKSDRTSSILILQKQAYWAV